MKKIALAMERFSASAGGAESYAVSLASTLAREGWEVHLFGKTWDGTPARAVFHEIRVPDRLPKVLKMLLFARRHKAMTEGAGFDVVVGFGNTIHMNVYQSHGGVHRLSTNRKVPSEGRRLFRAVKRLLILASAKDKVRQWIESAPFRMEPRPVIVAISHMVRDDMASFYHVPAGEIALVYNGVDTDTYSPAVRAAARGSLRARYGLADRDVVFLFVSYTLRKKGIVPLIHAAESLVRSGHGRFRVLVAGGRPDRSLARMMDRCGVEDRFVFAGPQRAMEDVYGACDVLVLPTYYDACSLVVIEAMACGLPAVTTVYNGASGIITHGTDGYVLAHPPSADDLARAMEMVLDRRRLASMSEAAAATGRTYSVRDNHRNMMALFEAVAEGRR